jgi:hypothetical protein
VNSLRIGWAAVAGVSIVTLLIGFADAQLARQKPEPGENLFKYATRPPSSDGWLPPDRRTPETVALQPARPPSPERNLPPVVIPAHGMGGNLLEHQQLFATYRTYGLSVELRGPCYSACTVLMSYVGKDKLCIGEGAFMAFHAARSRQTGIRADDATTAMYQSWPPEIRAWIDRNGGHENLPLNGFWTMYDRELWAMGYPRCK